MKLIRSQRTTQLLRNPDYVHDVWFFTSEIEGERASSFRQERWCSIFLQKGARVSVFNIRGAFSYTHAVFDTEAQFEAFRESCRMKAKPMASIREGRAARLIRRIKHLFLIDLFLPNIILIVWRAYRMLARSSSRVVLMASSPPFSVAVAGAILKRLHPCRLVFSADMRDAWGLHTALGGIPWIKKAIERAVLHTADYVTTVSYGLKNEYEATYGIEVGVMYNVATHYFNMKPSITKLDWASISSDIDLRRLKLVYTGSTPERFYDLISIIGGIKHFRDTRPVLADRIQLIFVGACEEVRRESERQGMTGQDIVFVPHVPQRLSKLIQANADALIFLGYHGDGNKGVVSTKIFEYLLLCKPIIPFSLHEGSDVDRLLRRYCGRSINIHTLHDISDALASIASMGIGSLPSLDNTHDIKQLLKDYVDHASTLLTS
jgi:hypothetical protein